MDLHAERRALCVREDDGRRSGQSQEIQREVCLPAGVHHERVHRAEETLRHHESGGQPGLQRLRHRHT